MKKISTLFFLFFILQLQAQIKAITEYGDDVILMPDKTWKYKEDHKNKDIPTSKAEYKRSPSATQFYKSDICSPFGFYVNESVWKKMNSPSEDVEIAMQLRYGNAFLSFIAEKLPLTIEALRQTIIYNAESVAPDLQILKEEFRVVNGHKVLMIQMKGTIHGISFIYMGYYYVDGENAIQLLTYTNEATFTKFQKETEELLNGFDRLTNE